MPEISSVTPGRGRAGDEGVAIAGAGFAPATVGNTVEFARDSIAVVNSESETDIDVDVPGIGESDQWVSLIVQRDDTFEFAAAVWWAKATLEELKTDSKVLEALPDESEDLDSPTNEFITATTWNRLITFLEFLTQEVLTAKGSVLGTDGDGPVEVLVGDDETELIRVPASDSDPTGLRWAKPKRVWTLRWGRNIDAANTRNGAMRANGTANDIVTGVKAGTHGMPRPGVLRHMTVNVEDASGGDTLDQVTVVYNLATVVHDSGTGLGLGVDEAYQVDLDTWRDANDLEVRAFKTGTADDMDLTATLTIEEELRPNPGAASGIEEVLKDAISVTDSITAEVILGVDPLEDSIEVTDSIKVEVESHRELADALPQITDSIAIEAEYHRELADSIDIRDSIEVELL